ncbi:phosphoribosyltransferase family protein [Pseudorhodobacter sp. W20_MBD10_FR17]|uniref:phosphoribosyltransferase-like protein n=1 Tax=Pseudorhodobacter sp. W20_MBD10_FR17 TaxID=3240266 RepID=UPI003F987DF2
MAETDLDRSSQVMGRDVFASLMSLSMKHTWLIARSKELFDILELCKSDQEKDLVVDLLGRFHFCSASTHLENLRQLSGQIVTSWGCQPTNSHIVALQDGECADSSSMIVQQLKAPFADLGEWKTHNFLNQLNAAVARSKNGDNIVIVDDFAGSGTSIGKKAEWLRAALKAAGKTASIRVAVSAAMHHSKKAIEEHVDEYHAINWLSKGISDSFTGGDLASATAAMERLETTLGNKNGNKKLDHYRFGYRRSEALYYLEGSNPPNNNFPIFWWPVLKPKRARNPLLRRV